MAHGKLTRKEFVRTGTGAVGLAALTLNAPAGAVPEPRPVVSVVKIKDDKVGYAVEKAIDLIDGIAHVTEGKDRILLKPNLVTDTSACTTKPEVTGALARLMTGAGKEVAIGEASSEGTGINVKDGIVYRTRDKDTLNALQNQVFKRTGYDALAKSLGLPLINLQTGEMVEVAVPDGLAFEKITLHKAVAETDLLCTIPMMKTHTLATVTLGMKNLIGLYPGIKYYAARGWLHDRASEKKSPGVAFETLDMVRVAKPQLTVIDGSMAMEGAGPIHGELLKMDVIVAGTNPLATDLVAAHLMGFNKDDVPTFTWANKIGMTPGSLDEIEIRGENIDEIQRPFKKPEVAPWPTVSDFYAKQEI